jgi:IS30 family transposase
MKPAHGRVWRLRHRLGGREARGSAAVDQPDQAIENASHAALTLATDIPVYFVHAHLQWERQRERDGLL